MYLERSMLNVTQLWTVMEELGDWRSRRIFQILTKIIWTWVWARRSLILNRMNLFSLLRMWSDSWIDDWSIVLRLLNVKNIKFKVKLMKNQTELKFYYNKKNSNNPLLNIIVERYYIFQTVIDSVFYL